MKCVFPCVLGFAEGYGYSVIFPDIAGATQGDTLYEALQMAEDFAGFAISSMIKDGEKVPEPTPIEKVELDDGEFVTLIRVDTEEYEQKESSRRAKHTTTTAA